MTEPTNLNELYLEELRDLASANTQMQQAMSKFAEKTSDDKLRELFQTSVSGIGKHTDTLRSLIGGAQGETICKGMAGLVSEAQAHALEATLPENLRDIAMIAQYQRMSHYGVAGFGTAVAYAESLGQTEQAEQLRKIVSDIYRADHYATALAESLERAAPKK